MTPKHIHLIGICGTAMASLAGMLQSQGHRVTGSDAAAYPPMSHLLAALNIPILEPYSPANLTPAPDLVVVGNAISRGNPELEHVLDTRLPLTSMAALLHAEFLQTRHPLVVTGTHGKTTTTSMLAWIFEVASRSQPEFAPSFLIGGVAENFNSSFRVLPTLPFLLEGDEYDTAFFDKGPKFLHYFPHQAILTHVEFDHADIYPDLAAVKTAFKRLVNLIPRSGHLLAFDASENVRECVAKAFCPVERYGFDPTSAWHLRTLTHQGSTTSWSLDHNGTLFAELTLPMPGAHNALNASAAAALAHTYGIPAAPIAEALRTFRSVKRRLELRAEVNGIRIIEDFAHHPTAIRETLRALRESYLSQSAAAPAQRLIAVLEPRSNTLRRNVFQNELVDALALADQVVLSNVFQSDAIPEPERLHPQAITSALNTRGIPAATLPDADAIVAHLTPTLRPNDIVAILSNGAFGNIYDKLPKALRDYPQPAEPPRIFP